MSSSERDDEWASENDEQFSLSAHEESDDSDTEQPEPLKATKRRRLNVQGELGLDLVLAAAQHDDGLATTVASAAHIDGSEEAEASLMQLEVNELLREARPDLSLETQLLELVRSLASLLRGLQDAPVPAEGEGAAAPIAAFLRDLGYQPVVSMLR
jgi:hypothetical protein